MTYKDVLDDLLDILKRHRMIQTWGYGNLSDLVSPFKREDTAHEGPDAQVVYGIDYPYAFLQPTNHNLAKGKSTFSFNLIMMEQCEDDPARVIQAQSNCYQYIQDVLAEIYYNYDQKFDFTLNSSVVPFKEKYDDTVSGMTATISIEIPMVLDDCIAPFFPKVTPTPPTPEGELQLWVESNAVQLFPVDVSQSPWKAQVTNIDTQNGWRPPTSSNFFTPTVSGIWSFVLEGEAQVIADNGVWPSSPGCIVRRGGQPLPETVQPTTTTWPTEQPAIGEIFQFRCEYVGVQHPGDGNYILWNWVDQSGVLEDIFRTESGTELKGYFTAV